MHSPTTETLCRLLAEPERLRVFAAIVLGTGDISGIAERASVSVGDAGKALQRLADAGLVSGTDTGVTAHPELFKEAVRQAAAQRPPATMHADPDRNMLLTSVFRDGRIRVMPSDPSKVRIVLEYLVTRFEPGTQYTEAQVNAILQEYFHDHAALRRYLVDTGLMERSDGVYRRTA